MKKKTMILLFSLPGLFLILCALTFRPISNPQMDECSLLQGKLAKVKSDPKTKDIYLRLEDIHILSVIFRFRLLRRRTGSVHKQSRQSNGHHRGFSFHDNHNVKLMLQI